MAGEADDLKTVTIAHRTATITNCDEIIAIEKGTVREKGRF